MNSPCTIRAMFSTALFATKISSRMKRYNYKEEDEQDVHHSDVYHEEVTVTESSAKESSLLHRKHHVKKPSAANVLSEEVDSGKPIAPGFLPQEIELSKGGLNSDEHSSSSSTQDVILPKVLINTYPTQNAAHIAHPNENENITLFASPADGAEFEFFFFSDSSSSTTSLEVERNHASRNPVANEELWIDLENGTRGETLPHSTHDPEMKNYFKLVCGMFTVSCGGFIGILVDLPGKNYSHDHDHHKAFLKAAYIFCVYASCILCLCVIAIYLLCRHTVQVAIIVKFLTWIVLASVAYALTLVVCLTTSIRVVEDVAVLALPIIPIGLVGLIRAKHM